VLGVDDVLRYAFSQGPGRDFVSPVGPPARPVTTSFGALPDGIATDRTCPLVWGTVDLLDDTVYPQRCAADWLSTRDRLQHALVMAWGLQRREPSNLFNDHRSCASVRSRFPVHAFVYTDDGAWLLDPYRHGLLPVGQSSVEWPDDERRHVALAGRYTHLPSPYGRLRGPLTELEMGIGLRALSVALEVFGLDAELCLPDMQAGRLMTRLGLEPAGDWTAPLTVAAAPPGQGPRPAPGVSTGPSSEAEAAPSHTDGDPTLTEAVAVNRTSLDLAAHHPAEARRGKTEAIPSDVDGRRSSWSDVAWRRSAGRMPRHLAGFSGRRRALPAAAINDAVAWLSLPPPSPVLQEVAKHITVSVCLQDGDEMATGWYRVRGRPAGAAAAGGATRPGASRPGATVPAQAWLELLHPDPMLPTRLEGCYGHGLAADVGCAVRHAAMIWMLSCDVPSLLEATGPGGWTLAQFVTGWIAHGLCLAAAAHGLYARPNRAFDEILLQPVVGLAPGEMVLLSVVSGTGRFVEPNLDLRT
jgi:hypothetical protein